RSIHMHGPVREGGLRKKHQVIFMLWARLHRPLPTGSVREPIGENMKKLAILAALVLIPAAAWADIVTSAGAGFVSVPGTFSSTTGSNAAPYWNNNSLDGMNMNAGDYLGGVNPSLGVNNYLS